MMGKLWNQNRKQFVAWFLHLKAIVADSNDINKTTAAKLEAKAQFFSCSGSTRNIIVTLKNAHTKTQAHCPFLSDAYNNEIVHK